MSILWHVTKVWLSSRTSMHDGSGIRWQLSRKHTTPWPRDSSECTIQCTTWISHRNSRQLNSQTTLNDSRDNPATNSTVTSECEGAIELLLRVLYIKIQTYIWTYKMQYCALHHRVTFWPSGNEDGCINEVTRHQAQLVLWWATVCRYAILECK